MVLMKNNGSYELLIVPIDCYISNVTTLMFTCIKFIKKKCFCTLLVTIFKYTLNWKREKLFFVIYIVISTWDIINNINK